MSSDHLKRKAEISIPGKYLNKMKALSLRYKITEQSKLLRQNY